ncbi:MAG: recombinase family protein [Tissierellaceae bacterium]|nr:recombinase family protein [Tissierellaceae bacterium]
MKTAAAYARFSTDMQREESIEAQLYDIKRYAEKNNIIITKIYTDEAVSGRSDYREGFKEMLKAAYDKEFDFIIVHKVDRFARNKYLSAIYKHKLSVKGVKVLYAAQHISDSPEGRLMEGMLENIAQYYSENLAQEVLKGLNTNARKAQFNGGTPPLGYDIDESKNYVINPKESIIVNKIFHLYLNGQGYTSICNILNGMGYKNKRGKPFVFNSIKPILTNKKYIGIYEYNKTSRKYTEQGRRNLKVINNPEDIIVVEDGVPAIIEKEVFYKVQEIIKSKQNVVQKHQKRKYILKGLVECGSCSNVMPGQSQTNRLGNRYYYYRCKKCKNSVNAEHLEYFVIEVIKQNFFNNLDRLKALILKELEGTQLNRNNEKSTIEKRITEIDKEQDQLIDFIAKGLASDKIAVRLKELDKELYALKDTLSKLVPTADITEQQVLDWLDELKNNLETYDKIDKVIRALVDKIVVYDDDIKVFCRITKECITLKGVVPPAPLNLAL